MTGGLDVVLDEAKHLLGEVGLAVEAPCLIRRRCRIEKKISTWLSHEACLGVKTIFQRGWASSQAATLGVL